MIALITDDFVVAVARKPNQSCLHVDGGDVVRLS